jgi:hypothetical protein
MDFGDEPEGSDSQRQRKRYHRHTPRQIQQLEAYGSLSFRFVSISFAVSSFCPVRPPPSWLLTAGVVVSLDELTERNVMVRVRR